MEPTATIHELSDEQLQRLGEARIFFGHHSVGTDILQGIAELAAERPNLGLRIVETDDPSTVEGPCLAHGRVGRNMDPASKRGEFLDVLERSADSLDLALMKFCYVDVNSGTDPGTFVEEYQDMLGTLRAAHPNLKLAHATVPLRASPAGVLGRAKDLARLLTGKPRSLEHNRARDAVNGLLRSSFDQEALFDLARVESTRADGTACREGGDATVPCMAPEYTTDGGHLSASGRRRAAEAFLVFLARRL
jgi:lysophospholipase L1-like esterase